MENTQEINVDPSAVPPFLADDNVVTVGKVRDAHGLKGELFIALFAKEAEWLPVLKDLTLVRKEASPEGDGKLVSVSRSFPIKRHKLHKSGIIVKVDGIFDRTEAETYQGALIQIPKTSLISKPGDKIFLSEILGFQVLKKGVGEIGIVEGFSSNGVQDLLVVKTQKGDFEIPLIQEFLVYMDFKNRVMEMDLPLGLLGEDAI